MKTRTAAIVGVHNTRQGRRLDGETSRGLALKAIHGALADAGLSLDDVDGISAGPQSTTLIYDLRIGPAWQGLGFGVGMITEAVMAIEHSMADVVVLVAAQAGEYRDHEATAPWTRPENEFVAPWGMFTTAEFALIARRHMHVYGTTREQLSIVAATIRNNGSRNPEAVYYQRGPFSPEDITASRPIADPFHLLDCATTSEGGCALVVANVEKVSDKREAASRPIYVLGSGADFHGPSYQHPPAWDLAGRRDHGHYVNGVVGRRAAERAFRHAGLRPADIDVLELYDPFSFEIIRQLEAFGFCGEGEGGPFVADGHIAIDGSHPVTTDGGTMSFSHAGANPQMMQRAIRAVQQLRGEAGALQVPDAHIALCSNGGGSLIHHTADSGRRTAVTSLQPQTGPVPHACSLLSVPFWQGCRSGELRYQRCAACGRSNFPPTEHCRQCLSAELRWTQSGGVGEVYSWTVVYRPVTPEFEPPYAPAIVTLDEGYQILTNIVGVAPEDLAIGMRVRVEFHAVDPDLTLPYFTVQG